MEVELLRFNFVRACTHYALKERRENGNLGNLLSVLSLGYMIIRYNND